jgi:hypothetical protein
MSDSRIDLLRLKNAFGKLSPDEADELRAIKAREMDCIALLGGDGPKAGILVSPIVNWPTSDEELQAARDDFDRRYRRDVAVKLPERNEVLQRAGFSLCHDGTARVGPGRFLQLPTPEEIERHGKAVQEGGENL